MNYVCSHPFSYRNPPMTTVYMSPCPEHSPLRAMPAPRWHTHTWLMSQMYRGCILEVCGTIRRILCIARVSWRARCDTSRYVCIEGESTQISEEKGDPTLNKLCMPAWQLHNTAIPDDAKTKTLWSALLISDTGRLEEHHKYDLHRYATYTF